MASEVTRQTETEIISSEYESEVTEESSSESEEETTTTETEYETPRGKSYFLSPSFFNFFKILFIKQVDKLKDRDVIYFLFFLYCISKIWDKSAFLCHLLSLSSFCLFIFFWKILFIK